MGAFLRIVYLRVLGALFISCALSACTTSREAFNANPKSIDKPTLCRTYLQSQDPAFQQDLAKELSRRGVQFYQCPEMVRNQDAAAAALVAVALVGTAVAVCANNNCGGGYPTRSYPGNCYSYYDRAADGSLCGHRSAMSRPGGW
ncbi:hypothetical protein F3P66_18760 [Agrobacterium fabrum]|uniref:Lipoprotein n=1 Tax=Agrobacterium fabrum (strain C58 / ATCC 33970) TaxID=176299 RepID=Q8U990_AGRFC|nr:hypothetical protein Atu3838 [Agrobacterium fabrum str. C58]QRM62412.1 hypothetical protein F3P66_18760 [Agrobacterium fabrum]TRB27446.1 hypothetical protein EXN51_19575 [Agrobacterium fabrum]